MEYKYLNYRLQKQSLLRQLSENKRLVASRFRVFQRLPLLLPPLRQQKRL